MLSFRRATRDDVPRIVKMLADDGLGRTREDDRDPLPQSYFGAFEAIDADPNNELVVADMDGEVVAVMQLTFIPYLTHRGSRRALIEGVRVASSVRGQGVGHAMIRQAIERATQRGCSIVQLTTDKTRVDALRFYESLGFRATHEGMKLTLTPKSTG
jgi:ribosomal protein S18 acetylase RimI-like enzyme